MHQRRNPDHQHRRSIRLPAFDYRERGAYFVTVCTHERRHLLGEVAGGMLRLNEVGRVVAACWDDLPRHYHGIELDAFVVMPNHIHGIIVLAGTPDVGDAAPGAQNESVVRARERATQVSPLPGRNGDTRGTGPEPRGPTRGSLGVIIGSFKASVTRRIGELARADATFTLPAPPLWQRNYYEHILRDDAQLDRARRYILENPARWAEDPENANPPR